MINKVAGYQGFSSYGDLAYPSLKAGKTVLSPNDVWEQTTRTRDESTVYDNHSHQKTIYKSETSQAVQPKDYQNHYHVKKGLQTQFQLTNTAKNTLGGGAGKTTAMSSTAFNPLDDTSKLVSGVEHWKSTYNATRIENNDTITKAERPEWTYHKKAYFVDCKVGPTEYKTTYGEFGTKPTDKLNEFGQLPIRKHDEDLKMGSTQSTFHIPNYGGFIPSARTVGQALNHAIATDSRKDKYRATIIDNYHTKIPGYAGHQPTAPINHRGMLRENCFSTVSSLKF